MDVDFIIMMILLLALLVVGLMALVAFDAGYRYGRKGLMRSMRRHDLDEQSILSILSGAAE